MPVYSPQEASWISRANAAVDGRRHLTDEELEEAITSEDPSLKIRNAADWLMRMGKTMEQKEAKKNEAMAQGKVSRGELIMALMGFCTMPTYNQLMVYTMAMMKVLEKKGVCTKEEIRAEIAEFAKGKKEGSEVPEDLDAAAIMTPDNPAAEESPADVEPTKLVDFPPDPSAVN